MKGDFVMERDFINYVTHTHSNVDTSHLGMGEEKLQITEELWREWREKLMRFCGKGVKRREVLHAGSLLPL